MSRKNLIIIFTILIVFIIGGAFWSLTNSNNSQNNNQLDQQTEDLVEQSDSDFLSIDQIDGPYTVSIEITDSEKNKSTALVEIESETRSRSVVKADGETIEFIIDGDSFYTYSEETGWLKIPAGDNDTASFTETYSLSQDQLNELEKFSDFKGERQCGSSTCRVYEGTFEGERATLLLEKGTNRVIGLESTSPTGEKVVVTYTYNADVNIKIPTDVQDLSSLVQ